MNKIAVYKEYIYKVADVMQNPDFANLFNPPQLPPPNTMLNKALKKNSVTRFFMDRTYDEAGQDIFDRVLNQEDHKYDRY